MVSDNKLVMELFIAIIISDVLLTGFMLDPLEIRNALSEF